MIKTDFIKADTDGFGFFSIILSIVNCQLSIDYLSLHKFLEQ